MRVKTNYLLSFIVASILSVFLANGQRTTFFMENMGTDVAGDPKPSAWTGWENPGLTITDDGNLDVRKTQVSAAMNAPYYREASGANNIFFNSSNPTDCWVAMEGIDASGFEDVELTFGYYKAHASTKSVLQVYYWENDDWVEIPYAFFEGKDEVLGWYRSPALAIPASVDLSNLKLKFLKPATFIRSIRLDDVRLTGIPKKSIAPIASDAANINTTTFTAEWNAVDDATGYLLDVSESPLFTNAVEADVLAAWTFPIPYVIGDIAVPNIFSTNNEGKELTCNATGNGEYDEEGNLIKGDPIPYGVGSGTEINPYAYSATGWEDGVYLKYFQIEIDATGYADLTLSSWHYSSANGPKTMEVQYRFSTDADWITVPNSQLTMPQAGYNADSKLTDLPLPSACDNQTQLFIRWVVDGNLRTEVKTAWVVTIGGTSRVTNIYVKGKEINTLPGYSSKLVTATSEELTDLIQDQTYYYRVRATDGTYVSNVSEVKSATPGVQVGVEKPVSSTVKVYFNTLTNGFEVKGLKEAAVVKVHDVNGRLLISQTVSASQNTIAGSNLSAGVYIINLMVDGQPFNFKCIK